MTANQAETRSPLERALLAIERLEAELEAAQRPEVEPIAIVGMGCRFPGGINDFASFTRRIFAAEPVFGSLPVERFSAHPLVSEGERAELEKRVGGFLSQDEVEGFDASFFRITPREAGYMDPQQRLLLRVAWEALEHAGIDPYALRGTDAEVYIGSHGRDYAQLGQDLDDKVSVHYSPGVDASFLAARISHFLDVHGTSLTVDTACSSSLVAIHLACKSLQTGKANIALAGGVKLVISPEIGLFLHKTGAMSPSGRCLPFDQSADGMVQAEGCGLLVLKRLSEARRDGDRIWGVIEGSAVNHDGTGAGLTVPNPAAQSSLIEAALRDARVHPHDVDYVEAHGTGTVVGDPIELRALARSYSEGRDESAPLLVGSAKATLGHSESAAGVAGVLRALAVLAAGRTPPAPYLNELNREFRSAAALHVPRAATALPARGGEHRAGVSSFGMSGVNAHLILTGSAPCDRRTQDAPGLLTLSAATAPGLHELTTALRDALATRPELSTQDVAHTMARRARHEERSAVAFEDRATLLDGLDALIQDRPSATSQRGRVSRAQTAAPVFVLSGQGSQWLGMGRELFTREPAFAASLREQDRVLRGFADWSLLELLGSADERLLADTEKTQPLLFAFQVAMVALYRAHGVTPAAVVGHSLGEITAAHVAGLLDLESALRLVVARGRLMGEARDLGYMVSVAASAAALEGLLREHQNDVSVAAVNAPHTCVLAGETAALDALREKLSARGIASERLPVAYAFHSPQMASAARGMEQVAAPLRVGEAHIPMFSTVLGRALSPADLRGHLGVRHWASNVRDGVRFADAVTAAMAAGHRTFLEIAPRAVLSTDIARVAESLTHTVCVVPAQRRSLGQQAAFLSSLGALFCAGVEATPLSSQQGVLVELPSYPFQLEPYWLPRTARRESRARDGHPWLGTEVRPLFAPAARIYQRTLRGDESALLSDHRVGDRPVLPAVLYLEAALHAGLSVHGTLPLRVENVRFERMVHLDGPTTVQSAAQEADGELTLQFAAGDAELVPCASAVVRRAEVPTETRVALGTGDVLAADAFYETLARQGMQYGPTYARITRLSCSRDALQAELTMDAEACAASKGCHLALPVIDAALHASLALTPTFGAPGREVFVPVAIEAMTVLGLPQGEGVYRVEARRQEATDSTVRLDVRLADASGLTLIRFDGVTLQRIRLSVQTPLLDQVLRTTWQARALRADEATQPPRSFLLVSEDPSELQPLSDLLRSLGHGAEVVAAWQMREKQALACDELVFMASDEQPNPSAVIDACLTVAHIARLTEAQPARLWLVTRGAHRVADGGVDPWQAPLNGLGRALATERADLRCVRVDLEPNVAGSELDALLLDELLEHDGEDEVAYRHGVRYVARLERQRRAPARAKPISPDGAHLITGGTGGIGLHVASYLLRRGARHVVLCSRSEPSVTQKRRIAELDPTGTRLHVLRADLTSDAAVSELLERIRRNIAPLRSVFHAAGVLDDGAITSLDRGRFERVLAPKLAAHRLDTLTRGDALDHFVLFSSVSALIGSPGQTNYCAGNAFMDTLAQARALAGLPALSLGWGAWRDTGMLASGTERRLAARGLYDFSPEEAIEALDALLGDGEAHLGVALFDPESWQAHYPHLTQSSLLRPFARKQRGPRSRASDVDVREELQKATDAPSRRRVLHARVTEALCAITAIAAERIGAEQTFASLGMDSLMTMELRNRVNALFKTDLSLSQFLDQGSVARIASLLDDRLATMALVKSTRPALSASTPGTNDIEMEELSL